DAGRVHQRVDPAQPVRGLRDRRVAALLVGDVARDRRGAPTDLGDRGLEPVLAPGEERDVVPRAAEADRHAATEPTGCSDVDDVHADPLRSAHEVLEPPRGTSRKGRSRSRLGSLGIPRTRSLTTLAAISVVPPLMQLT